MLVRLHEKLVLEAYMHAYTDQFEHTVDPDTEGHQIRFHTTAGLAKNGHLLFRHGSLIYKIMYFSC